MDAGEVALTILIVGGLIVVVVAVLGMFAKAYHQ